MVLLELQQFHPLEGQRKVADIVKDAQIASKVVFGIDIADKDIVQAIFAQEDPDSVPETLLQNLGQPIDVMRVVFADTILQDDKVAKAPVLEQIAHFFPAAQMTTQMRMKIEDDFGRFDAANAKDTKRLFLESGWSLEFENTDAVPGKSVAFVTIVGWTSMEPFEENLQRDEFKEALPILLAWKAPWKMWHTQRI